MDEMKFLLQIFASTFHEIQDLETNSCQLFDKISGN